MSANDKLTILWTTDNKDTVFNMLAMYALNSKNRGWWKHINIILTAILACLNRNS